MKNFMIENCIVSMLYSHRKPIKPVSYQYYYPNLLVTASNTIILTLYNPYHLEAESYRTTSHRRQTDVVS